MADDLGSSADDTTFRPGGALDKLYRLAQKWEQRAKKAERKNALKLASMFFCGMGSGVVVAISFLR